MRSIPLYLTIVLAITACNARKPVNEPGPSSANRENDTKALTMRLLTVADIDWQKMLVSGTGSFDGFELRNRNLNYLDLGRYSFNNTFLNADTLFKVRANGADTLEKSGNSFRYLYMSRSVLSGADFRNWHFVTDDLTSTDYWLLNKVTNTEFNNVVMRKMGIASCTFDNCFFRNTNYGSFKTIRFNRDTLLNCTIENAFFDESEFYGCRFTAGTINLCRFTGAKFGNGLGIAANTVFAGVPRIQGRFTSCQFNAGVKFDRSNILESEFNGGSFQDVEFLQDSYIKNSYFKNVRFTNVKFGITGLWDVTFGDALATSGNKMMMTGCDFRQAKWGPNVKFYNVNLQGSLFPARSVLNGYGVQFIGCQNEPQ